MIHHISAVTFAVRAMPEAITFYTQLGFTLVYGSPQARFSTLQAGDALINLTLAPHFKPTWWGRTIFRVDNVETIYDTAVAQGLTPSAIQNGSWGERYFHLTPTFKGVWSTAVNFVPVPLPDTKLGQYPPHHKRSDDSLGRHALGGWAYRPQRNARASLA